MPLGKSLFRTKTLSPWGSPLSLGESTHGLSAEPEFGGGRTDGGGRTGVPPHLLAWGAACSEHTG